MRVTILTMGSRGDVQPLLALGQGLVRAGHGVRFATHAEFEPLVTGADLEYASLPGDPRGVLLSSAGQTLVSTRNPAALPGRIMRLATPVLTEAAEPAEAACADADIVVAASLALVGPTAADRAGVPMVWAYAQPMTPTREFAFPHAPLERDLPRLFNRVSWTLAEQLFWRSVRPSLDRRRRELGMTPLPSTPPSAWPVGRRAPMLCGYSSTVVPTPADWPGDIHVTGYWTRPATRWSPPPELEHFLDAGPPPVYVGFGSMTDRDPAALAELLLAGVRGANLRAVVLSGWSGLRPADSTGDVLVVDEVPHDWLFPRMAAVLHHGGAGTTAAGFRAGVPSVVVPFFADQFFWGKRVAALGAGPPPLSKKRLTAPMITATLTTAVSDPAMRHAAQALATSLAAEDGVATAIGVLERLAAPLPRP